MIIRNRGRGLGGGVGAPGALKSDSFSVVAPGGKTVFATTNVIGTDFLFMEDGVENILRTVNKTGPQELTATTSVPQGTEVRVYY